MPLDYISENSLFIYKSVKLSQKSPRPIRISNWLIYSYSNNKILTLTRDLLYAYWEKHSKAIDYYIFHIFFSIAADRYHDLWENIPTFGNICPHILQLEISNPFDEKRFKQIKRMSDFHKLNWRIKGPAGSFYQYLIDSNK